MSNLSDPMMSQGDVMRRLADLERQLRELQTARRLESASIGRGGLRVKDGGRIEVIDDDGGIAFSASADGLTLDGLLRVIGDIRAEGGGRIRYIDAEGQQIVYIGRLFRDGQFVGSGLFVDYDDGTRLATLSGSGQINIRGSDFSLRLKDDGTWRLVADEETNSRAALFTTDGGDRIFQMRDGDNNLVVWISESQGLARPRVPISFGNREPSIPDGTFRTIAVGRSLKLSSHVRLRATALLVASNSAEIRLRETFSNTTIGTETLSSSGETVIEGANPRDFGADCRWIVEARRSSGTATTNLAFADSLEQLVL